MFVSFWKRRIVVEKLQYRLLLGNLMYLTSVVLIFFVVLFGPIVAILADESKLPSQREVAAHQFLALHERVWFALPVLIALCILHSVLISHRIAGPLHRFKRILASLAQGDLLMRVGLRKHDYLSEEAEIIEATLQSLRAKMQRISRTQQLTAATLPELMSAMGRGSSADSEVLAGKLATQLEVLGQQIRQFHFTDDDTNDAVREPLREPVRVRETVPAG